MDESTLTFARHSNLNLPVQLRISQLEGLRPPRAPLQQLLADPELRHAGVQQPRDVPPDLYCVVRLWASDNQLGTAFTTSHCTFKSPQPPYMWNERVVFPVKYRDLPSLDAQLTVTVYESGGPNKLDVLGGTTLRLFDSTGTLVTGQQRLYIWKGVPADGSSSTSTPASAHQDDERGRLEDLIRKQERGDLPRNEWLDKLAYRKIEQVHHAEAAKSEDTFLYIDLPRFDFPVIFSDPEYARPGKDGAGNPASTSAASTSSTLPYSLIPSHQQADFAVISDPEVARENPVEAKHRRLMRSHRHGPLDRELKPNAKIRDDLKRILSYPPTQPLSGSERDLVWQFRFYLTRDKRALTKFLKSVVWSDAAEVKQAVEVLLPSWSEVEMDDALELLGPGEAFRDRRVRAYAVSRLSKADNDEIMLYLLQLVQALKFEPSRGASPSNSMTQSMRHTRTLPASRASASETLDNLPSLEDLLIGRSTRDALLGSLFFWYISVECENERTGPMYRRIVTRFNSALAEGDVSGTGERLTRQIEFVRRISTLAKELRMSKEQRPKKIERLRAHLRGGFFHGLANSPVPLPLDARRQIIGVDPERSSVFKSNLFPLRLHLLCDDGEAYPLIFKNGDDLRQDQLVIQLFTLMDRLMRKEGLDVKLMPYRVLATAALDGMVQFVESKTLADISGEYGGSLLNFLRAHHPDPSSSGTYGVEASVLDTFVHSCAGYCVVTYLLGVGDRHLDNLLLSPDGHFFHVDFGYILGRDPKPFPPAVKVCKEMVDAMGGVSSSHYMLFKRRCYTAFTTLRRNANLIINLVALMIDANIPDIALEPDKAVSKVERKFLLEMTEEDAIKAFEALLNETSYFSSAFDRLHTLAQYWRA